MPALLHRNFSIYRYPLSNRRYIEIIADIFRVMVDIFEKSLIYLAGNLPGYPGHTQFQINKTKKRPAVQGAFFILILTDRTFHLKLD
ncbi:hypothetical protein BK708_24010 [Bacillus thuringiensis serovar yunnanensis]|nr:hypothetical protein BK708_24010 [Bacillus thuringiensis serovar yunnanensis]